MKGNIVLEVETILEKGDLILEVVIELNLC